MYIRHEDTKTRRKVGSLIIPVIAGVRKLCFRVRWLAKRLASRANSPSATVCYPVRGTLHKGNTRESRAFALQITEIIKEPKSVR